MTQSPLVPEELRPHVDLPDGLPTTASGETSARTLVQIHDHLRQELSQIREAIEAVADGRLDVGSARDLINRTMLRQNAWAIGSFCAQYCRLVTVHHTIEDRHVFPALGRAHRSLSNVLSRLSEEHEIIAEVLDRFDRELVRLVTEPEDLSSLKKLASDLGDALLSHLDYEERELVPALSRSDILI